jgi:hypothetical protein
MNNSYSTSTSSPYSLLSLEELPQNWFDKQMRDYITEKIIKDRSEFIRRNGGENFAKYLNKDVMLEKMKEFKQIQTLRKNYDPKTLKYYFPRIFKVDEDNRLHYTVAIPWYAVDCFDFVEYAAFDQILYYTDRYSYDIIPNTHVKVVGNRTSIIIHPLVRRSNTFSFNKKKDLYSKLKIDPENRSLPLHQYRGMIQTQRDVVIKSLYVNKNNKNIFNVLSSVYKEIRDQKMNFRM